MDVNPYASPEPPEEPIHFRTVGKTWPLWRRIGRIGAVLLCLGVMGAFGLKFAGIAPGWYITLALGLMLVAGFTLAVLSRVGEYANIIVMMFRGDYD